MSLNETPMAERVHIGFFGLRNAGKSSLVNRVTNQEMSLVSDVKGTTTDPVKKSMELLPLGPVTIIDTPGYDDEGALGEQRVRRTKEVLSTCDIAILVTEHEKLLPIEQELLTLIQKRELPYLIVQNKTDLQKEVLKQDESTAGDNRRIYVSAAEGMGIEELKERIAHCISGKSKQIRMVADLIHPGDTVVLVIPIDTSAPKGRLILPQQEAIRDILDTGAVSVVTGVENLSETINSLKENPDLVITDSQAFSKVMHLVSEEIPLTSFSILMARYKGFLKEAVRGAHAIDSLRDGDKVLICEGCTHHRQCEDIGTVKLPRWLAEYTGKNLELTFTSGHSFPEEPDGYDLIIHCGGCMLNDKEMQNRMNKAVDAGVSFTNYGTAIAHMNGILERSIAPILRENAL
ncbi:MAG: [FeFe] hydrogenase H-cluster maturation GTPase HydF [Acetatifactor sp.]|nr:[FeFe] hydrogenase H-cluster maturation GTPase HydF [Acetatifactor sp.]